MNWITDYVPPKIKNFFQRRDTPENLWAKCDSCGQMIFHRELTDNLMVCPSCNHHMPISPKERFASLFDGKIFTAIEVPEALADPLNFRDSKRYSERMRDARKKTGENEAMLVVRGELHGVTTVAAAQDFSFMGGSMGMAVGNALLKAAETAIEIGAPLIVFSAAGGARMQEGILSLMQMPRTTIAVDMMRDANLPFIVILTHPTTGGVTASFAMLGDVHLAEPDALICFAGPRVIEQTIREKLPDGFQRSEYLLDHGMIDRVVPRGEMRDEIGTILRMLMGHPPLIKGNLAPPAPDETQQESPSMASAP
ncbi:acetyl-CoA carboxylase, carboxyltransferase subunit beta [Rhodobacteraceae bacterium NNCM2]|nr:acetyl-CoA carboxylase, carboxyltransferase subunit beta [Coraliihabitans acroporae]